MNKNNVRKLCVLSALLVSVQIGGFLNSNSYKSSATLGNRFRAVVNAVRGAVNLQTGLRPIKLTPVSLNRESSSSQGDLNKNLVLSDNPALIQTSDPRHGQIKPIPADAKLLKTTLNNDGIKMSTGVLDGNYFTEASKEDKVILRSVKIGNGTTVTEWFAKDSDDVIRREFRTPEKIVTTKFLEDGSSNVEVKNVRK